MLVSESELLQREQQGAAFEVKGGLLEASILGCQTPFPSACKRALEVMCVQSMSCSLSWDQPSCSGSLASDPKLPA